MAIDGSSVLIFKVKSEKFLRSRIYALAVVIEVAKQYNEWLESEMSIVPTASCSCNFNVWAMHLLLDFPGYVFFLSLPLFEGEHSSAHRHKNEKYSGGVAY